MEKNRTNQGNSALRRSLSVLLVVLGLVEYLSDSHSAAIRLKEPGSAVTSWGKGASSFSLDKSDWASDGGIVLGDFFDKSNPAYEFALPPLEFENGSRELTSLEVKIYGVGGNLGSASVRIGGSPVGDLSKSETWNSYSFTKADVRAFSIPGNASTPWQLKVALDATDNLDYYDLREVVVHYSYSGVEQGWLEAFQVTAAAALVLSEFRDKVAYRWDYGLSLGRDFVQEFAQTAVSFVFGSMIDSVTTVPVSDYVDFADIEDATNLLSEFIDDVTFYENRTHPKMHDRVKEAAREMTVLNQKLVSEMMNDGFVSNQEIVTINSHIANTVRDLNEVRDALDGIVNWIANKTDPGHADSGRLALIAFSPLVKYDPDTFRRLQPDYFSELISALNRIHFSGSDTEPSPPPPPPELIDSFVAKTAGGSGWQGERFVLTDEKDTFRYGDSGGLVGALFIYGLTDFVKVRRILRRPDGSEAERSDMRDDETGDDSFIGDPYFYSKWNSIPNWNQSGIWRFEWYIDVLSDNEGYFLLATAQFNYVGPETAAVSPLANTHDSSGGNGTISVTIAHGVPWTAESNASWITIIDGVRVDGPGATKYVLSANTGARRVGTLTVAGKLVAITQDGTPQPGTVEFNNRIVGTVDARVLLEDGSGVGAGFTAQLYVGSLGAGVLTLPKAINPTTTFRTSSASAMGYIYGINNVTIPGYSVGERATLVMRVFNGASYESSTIRGESDHFTITLGGGNLPPAKLIGLNQFTVFSRTPPQKGNGVVQLNNRIVGTVDARVLLQDGSGVGAGWTAQLYGGAVGTDTSRLQPLSPTATFRTSSANAMGYVNSVNVTVPGFSEGELATVQLRVYNGASYESSLVRGESTPITVTLGGESLPGNLEGMSGFSVRGTVNSPPTITAIPDQTIIEDRVGTGAFTVSDSETPWTGLRLTAVSDNQTLLPNSNILFAGTGDSRTMTLIPAIDQTGIARITVTVTDGSGASASNSFNLTVRPDREQDPTISLIADQQTKTNTDTELIRIRVSDQETPTESLRLEGHSDNVTLIHPENMQFALQGGTWYLIIRPEPDQSGSANVTITVTDSDNRSANTTFLLSVLGSSPTISEIGDQVVPVNGSTGSITFTVKDQETFPAFLTVEVTSSNLALVPHGNVIISGDGENRSLTVNLEPNKTGSSIITLKVIDGEGLDSTTAFEISSVVIENQAPEKPNNLTPAEGATDVDTILTLRASDFKDSDVEDTHVASQWIIRQQPENATVFDSGEDTMRLTTLTLFPSFVPWLKFSTSLSWQVRYKDNHGNWSDYSRETHFTTLPAPNTPPTITAIVAQTTQFNQKLSGIRFYVDDKETSPDQLVVTAHSMNQAIVPNGNIVIEGGGTERELSISPAPNGSGATQIEVTVTDEANGSQTTVFEMIVELDSIEPTNDMFANRIQISTGSVSLEGSTVNATSELGEPNHANNQPLRSVWWSWTAADSGNVTVTTKGSEVDTLLAVYLGTSVGNLVEVVSNDDDPSGGSSSWLSFEAQAGVEYQIAVDSFGGQIGRIRLALVLEANRAPMKAEVSGRNIVLSWSADIVGAIIESSNELGADDWEVIAQAPGLIGEDRVLKIPITTTSQFYRLRTE